MNTHTETRAGVVMEFLTLFAAMTLWLVLFAIGLFVDSAPHRIAVADSNRPFGDQFFHWAVAIVSYTFTNIALLSVFSAVLGAAARQFEHAVRGRANSRVHLAHPYAAAALRGFCVYLMAISGLIFMVEGLFKSVATSADAYIRLSGGISMAGFLIGFSPEIFARILSRLAALLEEHAGPGNSAATRI